VQISSTSIKNFARLIVLKIFFQNLPETFSGRDAQKDLHKLLKEQCGIEIIKA